MLPYVTSGVILGCGVDRSESWFLGFEITVGPLADLAEFWQLTELYRRQIVLKCVSFCSGSVISSSHNHDSVENGCIFNMSFLSFRVTFHFHGRKGS